MGNHLLKRRSVERAIELNNRSAGMTILNFLNRGHPAHFARSLPQPQGRLVIPDESGDTALFRCHRKKFAIGHAIIAQRPRRHKQHHRDNQTADAHESERDAEMQPPE